MPKSKKREPFTGVRLPKKIELARVAVICQQFIQDEAGVSGTDADHFVGFLREALSKPDDFFIRVAVEEDQIVGSIGVIVSPRWDRKGKVAMILWAVLGRGGRRHGWGKRLVEKAEVWAREQLDDEKMQLVGEIWASVPNGSSQALGFYPAVGFRAAETLFKKEL